MTSQIPPKAVASNATFCQLEALGSKDCPFDYLEAQNHIVGSAFREASSGLASGGFSFSVVPLPPRSPAGHQHWHCLQLCFPHCPPSIFSIPPIFLGGTSRRQPRQVFLPESVMTIDHQLYDQQTRPELTFWRPISHF